jgi:hypothetical protein
MASYYAHQMNQQQVIQYQLEINTVDNKKAELDDLISQINYLPEEHKKYKDNMQWGRS